MTSAAPVTRQHGNPYEIFILVVTVLSLAVMAVLLLPVSEETRVALNIWDNFICFIFIGDFIYNITGSLPRSAYFVHQRGWLDLLGSIPSFGFFQYAALLRLFRLSRLTRIMRLLGGKHRSELIRDVVENRGQYAAFITILLALVVVSVSSILVLQFESSSADANINTGGDALWWAIVTITTVGYGDFYPVTTMGRLTGVFVMFSGIGIIGALASILASLLVSPAPAPDGGEKKTAEPTADPQPSAPSPALPEGVSMASELADAKRELADTRGELVRTRSELDEVRLAVEELNRSLPSGGDKGTLHERSRAA